MSNTLSLRLTGAHTLVNGAFTRRPLCLAGGKIAMDAAVEVDLSGYLVLPGIVDLQSGGLSRHLCARHTRHLPYDTALAAADHEAAAHGVTTSWLAQEWSWAGGQTTPDVAEAMAEAWTQYRAQALTDLRLQIVAQTHAPDTSDRLVRLITRYGIDSVIFANHLPEALLAASRETHRIAAWAEAQGIAMEDHIANLRAAKDRAGDVPRALRALTQSFNGLGVTYGSFDDPDGETREHFRMLGARLALCPVRAGAARVARANSDPVVLDASELLRGGMRPGAVSAQALVAKGLCDAFASCDHPAALAAAVWQLVDQGDRSLAEVWSMISETPARIMAMYDRGQLTLGARADIAIMNPQTRRIEATLVAGRIAHLSGGVAARFLSAGAGLALAAE